MKVTFMGAGSTVFARNILGDCIVAGTLGNFDIALFDIDEKRLKESFKAISAINNKYGSKANIVKTMNRVEALNGADFVVNAIQVGGYKPSTVRDFDIPKKYGLRQTIADTLGIGGIFRGLRTIHVLEDFAKDMEKYCPDALLINYTNPMAILSGYMNRYTKIKTVGLCHSVQVGANSALDGAKMNEYKDKTAWKIAGINHQAWLLDIKDEKGNDLYPQIRKSSIEQGDKINIGTTCPDSVRHAIMKNFGYYTTESSEHASEYLPYFIKKNYPELIKRYRIPLDEYPRRCIWQIKNWKAQKWALVFSHKKAHKRSHEYGSYIIEAGTLNKPYTFHGNIINNGLIKNLPNDACVEVPITICGKDMTPTPCGEIPAQCASLNNTNINAQLLAIEAARTRSKELLYMAAYLDPHTASELSRQDIKEMCDELYETHRADGFLPQYN